MQLPSPRHSGDRSGVTRKKNSCEQITPLPGVWKHTSTRCGIICTRIRGLGGHFWWWCALCAAPPAARRSGGRHWCGAERFLSGEPQSPPAAASTPRAVPGWTPARSAIPALAAGSQHLGQLLAEPPQGRHARAGDGLRQRLKGSRFSHHRARAAAGVPHAAVRHPLLPSLRSASLHRELGDRVG